MTPHDMMELRSGDRLVMRGNVPVTLEEVSGDVAIVRLGDGTPAKVLLDHLTPAPEEQSP